MNTPLAILLVLLVLFYLYVLSKLAVFGLKAKNKSERKGIFSFLLLWLLGGVLSTVVFLNSFGYAQLPLVNKVTTNSPPIYQPPTKRIDPPVNGPIQPSSQPAISKHKEEMERLKKNGF